MARYCYVNEKNPLYEMREKYSVPTQYNFIVKIELCILPVVILLFASTFFPVFSNAKSNQLAQVPISNQEQILGATTPLRPENNRTSEGQAEITPTPPIPTVVPSPIPTIIPLPTLAPIPEKSHAKNDYKIAVYGDSMVDTMGERLEYLEHSLKKIYPGVNFTLYNYGKGSENVEMGLNRWNNALNYQDRHYPSIVDLKPDIIVIGSFAYNPFSPYIRDRHWIGLTKLVQQAETLSPNVYMLAEIAPLRSNFGKGPMGVNYDTDTAYTHSGWIVEQLENVVGLSKSLHVPLIDVFDASKGHPEYTNPSDGIHPSVSGHEFTADIIAHTININ